MRIPDKISGFLSTPINQIIDCLIALQPIRSPDFRYDFTPRGIITRFLGKRAAPVDAFPWDLLRFGYSSVLIDGSTAVGKVRILGGAVRKLTLTPAAIDQVDLTIGESLTWVGLQIKRDLTEGAIITAASEPVSDDDFVKVWFYQMQTVGGIVQVKGINLGQIMDVDISAYGD